MSLSNSRRRTCALRTLVTLIHAVGLALVVIILSSAESLAAEPGPEYAFLSWESKGPHTHETHFGPTTGLMLFTTVGDDIVRSRTVFADDPAFASRYASELPAMGFQNGVGSSAADGLAQMIFSPPLPEGSQLIVIDVDIANRSERVEFTTVGGMLELLTQAETRAGANSTFPTWNPTTGILQSVQNNEEEATIFDVSGVEGLAMRYLRNSGGRAVTGVHFVIAVPVPEPQAVLMIWIAGVAAATFIRQRRLVRSAHRTIGCHSIGLAFVLMVLSSTESLAANRGPQYAFLSWESMGPSTHETHFGPTTGLMLFTTVGDDIVYPRPFFAHDPAFVSQYASELPAMWFENGAGGSAADGLAQMIFSPPLPEGSRLIVLDVDIVSHNERMEISTVGGLLQLLTQVETRVGANSAFPTWNPETGVLRAVRSNQAEASIFDVSRVEGLAMRYLRNDGGPGVSGIQFAIAVPVPEPAVWTLAAVAWPGLRHGPRRFRQASWEPT